MLPAHHLEPVLAVDVDVDVQRPSRGQLKAAELPFPEMSTRPSTDTPLQAEGSSSTSWETSCAAATSPSFRCANPCRMLSRTRNRVYSTAELPDPRATPCSHDYWLQATTDM